MDFHGEKPIYLQIADVFCESILSGTLKDPNTVMRVYEKLTAEEIIYNKRGIGYFVSPEAREKILDTQRTDFLEKEVPVIRRKMELLGLDETIFKTK